MRAIEKRKRENELAEKVVASARGRYEDEGSIEIDHLDNPRSQLSERSAKTIHEHGGVYVRAWVWVDKSDLISDLGEEHYETVFGSADEEVTA